MLMQTTKKLIECRPDTNAGSQMHNKYVGVLWPSGSVAWSIFVPCFKRLVSDQGTYLGWGFDPRCGAHMGDN